MIRRSAKLSFVITSTRPVMELYINIGQGLECQSFPRSRYDSEHIVLVAARYKHVRQTKSPIM